MDSNDPHNGFRDPDIWPLSSMAPARAAPFHAPHAPVSLPALNNYHILIPRKPEQATCPQPHMPQVDRKDECVASPAA